MKTDLATSVIAAIICIVAAYFVCNLFLPEISEVSFKILQSGNNNYELVEPNEEVFNYRAIDPAVEVYVGQCEEYDENGNCMTNTTNTETTEEESKDDTTKPDSNTPNEENQDGATD